VRIGLVCPYSLDVPGGVQSHVRDLARSLLDRGHDVRLLAPGDRERARPPYVETVPTALTVPFNGSVARLAFGPRAAQRTARWLRDGDFDVVHVHEPTTPSLSLIAVCASRRPVVATFHTARRRSLTADTLGRLLRPALKRLSAQIAVSEAARLTSVALSGGALRSDPVVVPNGVDYASFSSAAPAPAWTRPGPTIGFLGRWDEPRKGLRVLLHALPVVRAAFPSARLLVAGPGGDRRQPALAAAAGVECLGALTDAERATLLASVDVFVAPNVGGESFGLILVEAMAAGAVVVASDLPAFAAVLDRGQAGRLFTTGDPAALGAAVVELLGDPDAARELGAHGRARAKAYDWAQVVPQIEAVYDSALGSGAEDRPDPR
jgi:phosphatidylinositol alpha-mannosyltransferase